VEALAECVLASASLGNELGLGLGPYLLAFCHLLEVQYDRKERWQEVKLAEVGDRTAKKALTWKKPYVSFGVLDAKPQAISGFSNNPGACAGALPRG
jgi:hypothetical protein